MPRTSTITVQHVFNGGWRTGLGETVDLAPDQNGNLAIPYVDDAENIEWQEDGGFKKTGGVENFTTSTNGSVAVRGMFDFWVEGKTNSPHQHIMFHSGGAISYGDNSIIPPSQSPQTPGNFDVLKTGLDTNATPSYVTFDDLLIISTDNAGEVPQSWDGSATSTSDLASDVPKFAFAEVHKNRVWAAGVAETPSRLFFSGNVDPTEWDLTQSGEEAAGFIDIDPNDGDRITGIASYKNELWVFKGPRKGSIHRITGSSPTDFARTTFTRGLGCVSHNTIFQFKDDLGFMWNDGTIHSLKATSSFGDYFESTLSADINDYVTREVASDGLSSAWAVNMTNQSRVFFLVPTAEERRILVMDYKFERPRWSYWTVDEPLCLASVLLPGPGGLSATLCGGDPSSGDGQLYQRATHTTDGGGSYRGRVTTPRLSYGSGMNMKSMGALSVNRVPAGEFVLRVGVKIDDEPDNEANIEQYSNVDGRGHVLDSSGTASDFTLDSSTIGVLRTRSTVDRQFEVDEITEFRHLRYEFRNATAGQGLWIRTFSSTIKQSGYNTEN